MNLREHLPVLQVVVPLLSAPMCVLARHRVVARLLATGAAIVSLVISGTLLRQVLATGPMLYRLGDWAPPWGIEYRVDLTTAYVLIVVTGLACLILPLGPGARSHDVPENRHALYYAALCLCLTGLLGLIVTADAFNVFVFLEISSLSTYILVSLGRRREALRAAFSYLIVGTIGGTFVLIGIGLAYQATGTLNMADLAGRLAAPETNGSRTVLGAFAFLTVGLALKLAVFPLHQWLPNAYANAPVTVSAFIAGTATKVIYYLFLRFVFTVFGATFVFGRLGLDQIVLPMSVLAMFFGSIGAIFQTDFRRLLAYSSIAQVGYLTLALGLESEAGIAAGLIHLFNHALMKSGLFVVAAAWLARVGDSHMSQLAGLGRVMPFTSAAFVVGGLGMIGLPGTVGFISKWTLVSAAIDRGSLPLAAAILVSSLLALVYVWRTIEILFFRPAPANRTLFPTSPLLSAAAWVLMLGTLFFGIYTDLPVGVAQSAAHTLVNSGASAGWGGAQ